MRTVSLAILSSFIATFPLVQKKNLSEGFCMVKNNDAYNYVNLTSGSLLLSEWCDDAEFFKDGFGKIKKGEDWYKVDKNGEITKIETE